MRCEVLTISLGIALGVTGLPPCYGEEKAASGEAVNPRVNALYELGQQHYERAEFAQAVQCFEEAYALSGDTGLLFNLAQAHRKLGDCEQALGFYRSYLKAEPDAADRGAVERLIGQMDLCAGHETPVPAVEAHVEKNASDDTGSKEVTTGRVSRAVDRRSMWLPWLLVGLGGAGASAGVTLLATAAHDLSSCSPRCTLGHVSVIRTRADVAYGLMGAGAAASVLGIVIMLIPASDDASTTSAWVSASASGLIGGVRF
jgi:tetratricopeptide (TPR) repeat protein